MYQLWKNWYRQLHWTRKWFPIFVLIRPLVDNFFWLKEISPLLSPLTIVGVLTPLLCLVSFNNPRMPGKIRNSVDSLMSSYGAVVLINCFVAVSYTHLRAHETVLDLVCRLLLEKKKNQTLSVDML